MSKGNRIRKLLLLGKSEKEIKDAVGCAGSTVTYHKRKLGIPVNSKYGPKYDWDEIQEYYNEGNSYSDLQDKFGMAKRTIEKAIGRGDFIPREQPSLIETYGKRTKSEAIGTGNYQPVRTHARLVMESSDTPKECASCGWRHHADVCHVRPVSDFSDEAFLEDINSLDNLIYLCPNCHWLFDNGILALGNGVIGST